MAKARKPRKINIRGLEFEPYDRLSPIQIKDYVCWSVSEDYTNDLTAKDCRRIADWLNKAADWMERK